MDGMSMHDICTFDSFGGGCGGKGTGEGEHLSIAHAFGSYFDLNEAALRAADAFAWG
jgi:hypothetical protein